MLTISANRSAIYNINGHSHNQESRVLHETTTRVSPHSDNFLDVSKHGILFAEIGLVLFFFPDGKVNVSKFHKKYNHEYT